MSLLLSRHPDDAAAAICEAMGGRVIGYRWIRRVLEAMERTK
jgi:hypothetical protein